MKEIHVCKDGNILRYRYSTKTRYIIHKFSDVHSGKLVKTDINKEITIETKKCGISHGVDRCRYISREWRTNVQGKRWNLGESKSRGTRHANSFRKGSTTFLEIL